MANDTSFLKDRIMYNTLLVKEKNGTIHHFIDSDWKDVLDCIVVSQYISDETYGGYDNVNNVVFDKSDVEFVRYEYTE